MIKNCIELLYFFRSKIVYFLIVRIGYIYIFLWESSIVGVERFGKWCAQCTMNDKTIIREHPFNLKGGGGCGVYGFFLNIFFFLGGGGGGGFCQQNFEGEKNSVSNMDRRNILKAFYALKI